jgi:hypothetical protein
MKTLIILSCLFFSGCSVLWTDYIFVGTLFKNFDANDVEMIADPNYVQIGGSIIKSKNDSIKVITPSVILETGNNK